MNKDREYIGHILETLERTEQRLYMVEREVRTTEARYECLVTRLYEITGVVEVDGTALEDVLVQIGYCVSQERDGTRERARARRAISELQDRLGRVSSADTEALLAANESLRSENQSLAAKVRLLEGLMEHDRHGDGTFEPPPEPPPEPESFEPPPEFEILDAWFGKLETQPTRGFRDRIEAIIAGASRVAGGTPGEPANRLTVGAYLDAFGVTGDPKVSGFYAVKFEGLDPTIRYADVGEGGVLFFNGPGDVLDLKLHAPLVLAEPTGAEDPALMRDVIAEIRRVTDAAGYAGAAFIDDAVRSIVGERDAAWAKLRVGPAMGPPKAQLEWSSVKGTMIALTLAVDFTNGRDSKDRFDQGRAIAARHVDSWTPEQRAQAVEWARTEHVAADNDDVQRLPKPEHVAFLEDEIRGTVADPPAAQE